MKLPGVLLIVFLSLGAFAQEADSSFVVRKIDITGNGVTHESIILRELPFKTGDTISIYDTASFALQAGQNLVNTSLFHFATVSFSDSGLVNVNVTERWYIWPVPFFNIEERNFNVWLRNMSLEKVTYGFYVYHENFRGRKEYLKLLCKTGYNQVYGVSYLKPYIDNQQNWGFSAALGFEASHSISYNVVNLEPQNLNLPDNYAYSGLFSQLAVTRRVGMHQLHKFSVMYEATSFADSLMALNPLYAPADNWKRFTLNYQYRYDFRDVKNYPLHGWYTDAEFNFGGSFSVTEANDNQYFVKSTSRKYFSLTGPFYFATGATFYISLKEGQNFANAGFMGYGNNFVRGFQYAVIPVKNYLIHRSNLKYNLLKQRILNLPLIRTEKFNKAPVSVFTNLFFDQGWSECGNFSSGNELAGEYLAGYGIGIDFVTYYDKVLRIEFTMNRFREKGIFLHFTAPV